MGHLLFYQPIQSFGWLVPLLRFSSSSRGYCLLTAKSQRLCKVANPKQLICVQAAAVYKQHGSRRCVCLPKPRHSDSVVDMPCRHISSVLVYGLLPYLADVCVALQLATNPVPSCYLMRGYSFTHPVSVFQLRQRCYVHAIT